MTADDSRLCEMCGRQLVDHALAMLGEVAAAGSYRDDGSFHVCVAACLDAHLTTIVGLGDQVRRLRDGYRRILTAEWINPSVAITEIKHIARLAMVGAGGDE